MAGKKVQIQDDYSGTPLAALADLGLRVYDLIPDYRDRCPICRGEACAVRHGLYYRRVVDGDGGIHEAFPVPRFRCRRRGPRAGPTSTFSVLPAELVSRRRLSLAYMVSILELLLEAGCSVQRVLDHLAEGREHRPRPWFPDPSTVYRVLHLFSETWVRWRSMSLGATDSPAFRGGVRARARRALRALNGPARAAPTVLGFHSRHFPRLLFESPRS